MNFKAAIFDLDGTLVDSYKAWEKAYKKILRNANHDMTDEEFLELYRMTVEESGEYFRELRRAGRIVIPGAAGGGVGGSANDAGGGYMEAFTKRIFSDIRKEMETLYETDAPGKPYALDYVKSLYEKGVPLCVATLTPSALSEPSLRKTGFFRYMDFVITSDDVGLSKKFPDIFLEAAKRLGAAPGEAAVFEDCPTAMETARKAGFKVCGVSDIHRTYDVAEVSRLCDWYITDFRAAPDPA